LLAGMKGSVCCDAAKPVGMAVVSLLRAISALSVDPHSAQNRLIPLLRAPQTGQVRLVDALEDME